MCIGDGELGFIEFDYLNNNNLAEALTFEDYKIMLWESLRSYWWMGLCRKQEETVDFGVTMNLVEESVENLIEIGHIGFGEQKVWQIEDEFKEFMKDKYLDFEILDNFKQHHK